MIYVNFTDIRTKHQHLTHHYIPITKSIKRIESQRLPQNPLHQASTLLTRCKSSSLLGKGVWPNLITKACRGSVSPLCGPFKRQLSSLKAAYLHHPFSRVGREGRLCVSSLLDQSNMRFWKRPQTYVRILHCSSHILMWQEVGKTKTEIGMVITFVKLPSVASH